jgi:hypothetical protein
VKYLIIIFGVLCIVSCKPKQQEANTNQNEQSLLSVAKVHKTFEKVKPKFQQGIEDWKELRVLENFIERFKKVSPNEVLGNALELEELIKNLKDSVQPTIFETASFRTRVNILHNESLRLSDMTTIPSIKAEEVNHQTDKIINAFSAMNAKVNTILSKKEFEDAITIDAVFIGLDSTKIDSVSRNSIRQNLEQQKELQSKQ